MGNGDKPTVKVEPFVDEPINPTKAFEDTEVDILNWTNKGDIASNKNEDPDATEYSSSFADTTSEAENDARLSDVEVESELNESDLEDSFGAIFPISSKKMKLSDHWKNFIQPIRWRCKWVELKLKQFESQALKYSEELAEYDKRKHGKPDHFTLEEKGSKSFPFLNDVYRSKARKRRKRKRVEETPDLASYTSHHVLFSYLENKKSDADGALADDFDNPVIKEACEDSTDRVGDDDEQSFFEFSEADASLEQILWSIDLMQSRVHKMKNDVDAIMTTNASKISPYENYCFRYDDEGSSSARSPMNSGEIVDTASVGGVYNSTQHAPEFDFGDFMMAESTVSGYGKVATVPDIIESTVGLLSSADVTLHQDFVGDSCEDMVDNVLMHEVAETVEHTFKDASHVVKVDDMVKIEEEESVPPVSQEESTLKPCVNRDVNLPKNKGKRGERKGKAGSGSWSMKGSGESDNP